MNNPDITIINNLTKMVMRDPNNIAAKQLLLRKLSEMKEYNEV